MGNALGGRKKTAKVMMVDGSTFKVKPPVHVMTVLRDHPGHALLDADKVQRLGLLGRPLELDAPLKPGKLYFLVELRRLRDPGRSSCTAWSGELQSGAGERLENLRHSRRSISDLSRARWSFSVETEETKDGTVRLRMRLPKAQVEKLMQESKNTAEAAHKIMQLCAPKDVEQPTDVGQIKEKRTRFLATPDVIIA
ncbi:hypothetical protein Cni_G22541 [Canna indica]|uniref:Uncharacterized protein n=1 Tax=Canna indica TaxID=4628 RepID=A0AAQ3KUC1_9LILI|nr:hypothetical protein Cni_G22541 [Canna indica]